MNIIISFSGLMSLIFSRMLPMQFTLGGISPPAWSICRLTLDHHLTTTVQWHYKMPEKPVVTTNNGLFLVSSATVQNQQNLRFIVGLYRPVVVLRPGRPEVRILPVAPNNENPNLFSIGEGFGFFVFFGNDNSGSFQMAVCPKPYQKNRVTKVTTVKVP